MKAVDLTSAVREPLQGHTSKGDQPKWRIGESWYKADFMGYEALSEVIVSKLLGKTNVTDFVQYEPVVIVYDGKKLVGCESRNFKGKDEMLVPLEKLHRAYHGIGLAKKLACMETAEKKIDYTVGFVEGVTNLKDFGPYLTTLLELDSFFLNEDRHTNNIAVIRNEKTLTFRLCPIFDNGLSLLADINDYPLGSDEYSCIAKVKAKPFDPDFNEQVSAAEQLYGPQINLFFEKRDIHNAIESVKEYYDSKILQRVEIVLLEQIRKYPVYLKL